MTEDKWKWWHLSHNFAMFKVDVTIFWNFHQVYKINFFLNSGNLRESPTLSSPSPSPSATFRAYVLPTGTSLVVQSVKNLHTVQETQVWSLGQEDPLKKKMATHSSILAWRISWTEEPGGLQSMGLQESDRSDHLSLSRSWQHAGENAARACVLEHRLR